jgi:protein SCO1/2
MRRQNNEKSFTVGIDTAARRVIFFVALAIVLAGSKSQAVEKVPAPEVGIDQHLNAQVPLDLVFRDEKGNKVALGDYIRDKPVILVLAQYRCPRLCSLVLNGLVESLGTMDYEIGKEFVVLTVSFDARETPELAAAKKAAYVERYGRPGCADGWHFLTGKQESIKRLTDAVGFRFSYDSKRDQFSHASGIMVLTPDGKIARYFFGLAYLPRDVRFGLEDAAAGKIGSPIARPLRLLCFAYDPATGKYTLMTMRLVRLGGGLMVAALGLFWLWNWRRGARKRGEVGNQGEEKGFSDCLDSLSAKRRIGL